MAIKRITAQDNNASTATASTTTNYPFVPTVGNTLIGTTLTNVGVGILTMPAGWVKWVEQTITAGTVNSVALWYKVVGVAEPTSITANATGATKVNIHLYEYTGVLIPVTIEQSGSSQGSGTVATLPSGNVTTLYDDSLVFATWGTNSTITLPSVDSGFTLLQQDAAIRLFDASLITTSQGSYGSTGSWTGAVDVGVCIAAFRAGLTNKAIITHTRPHPFSPGRTR